MHLQSMSNWAPSAYAQSNPPNAGTKHPANHLKLILYDLHLKWCFSPLTIFCNNALLLNHDKKR